VTAPCGFLSYGAGFISRRHHSLIGTLEIAVLNLPDDVEHFADVPALVVRPTEADQHDVFESRVLEEVGCLMSP
jgi:hypothetical protein